MTGHVQRAEAIFKEFLQSRKMYYTRERRLVLGSIMRKEGHFSLGELATRLSRTAGIHRATLYRVLPLLEESGIIRRSPLGKPGHWGYEHVVGHEHHDHFLCIRCGKVTEFQSWAVEDAQRRLCAQYGVQEVGHQLCIRVICRDCREQGKGKRKK